MALGRGCVCDRLAPNPGRKGCAYLGLAVVSPAPGTSPATSALSSVRTHWELRRPNAVQLAQRLRPANTEHARPRRTHSEHPSFGG
jgi:hypothetical protein